MGFILRCEEGMGYTLVASAARSTNAVNIIIDGEGEGVINHILHFGDVKSTRSNVGSDEEWTSPILKLS